MIDDRAPEIKAVGGKGVGKTVLVKALGLIRDNFLSALLAKTREESPWEVVCENLLGALVLLR